MTEAEHAQLMSRFTVDPAVRSGKPCIRGIRITPLDVPQYLAGEMTSAEILNDFPELEVDDIRACMAFAVEAARREQELIAAAARWQVTRKAVVA